MTQADVTEALHTLYTVAGVMLAAFFFLHPAMLAWMGRFFVVVVLIVLLPLWILPWLIRPTKW